ncbi:MAG: DNA-3-methyladenine glycosylase [Woeseiaceae bacterium]
MKARLNSTLMRRALRHLRSQPADFATLIRAYPACPLHQGQSDLFHTLASSIIGQQLSVKAAATIENRVIAASRQNRLDATALNKLSTDACRRAGLSGAKTRYIRGLAQAFADGDLNFRSLAQQTDEAVIEQLSSLPGVGVWTAQMFLMFGFRRPDIAAPADVGLQRGMQMLLDLPERPDNDTFLALSAPWRPYRSVASWYLWRLAG